MLNKEYVNKVVVAAKSNVNIQQDMLINGLTLATVTLNNPCGRASGEVIKMANGTWLQVNLYKATKGKTYGYVLLSQVKLIEPLTNDQAESNANKLLADLAANDEKTFNNIIQSSAIIVERKKKGKATAAEEKRLKLLITSLNTRQTEIKNSKLIAFKVGFDARYKKLVTSFKSYLGISEPVTISTGVLIGGSIVIGAGLAAAVYYAFKPKYDDGVKDLKESNDLKELLSKADPTTAANIRKDLEQQIDDAYNQGKSDNAFSFEGFGGALKLIAYGGLGYLIYKEVKKK